MADLLPDVNIPSLGGILHLQPEEYAQLVVAHGTTGELRQGMVCPCSRTDSHTPRLNCPACKGMGWTYPESMRCPIYFLDYSRTAQSKYGQPGLLTSGTLTVTFPPGVVPGIGDMLLPNNEVHVIHQRLWDSSSTRVASSMVSPFRNDREVPTRQGPKRFERLLYPETECIEAVAYMDADGELVMPRESDYRVDDQGGWHWHEGTGPRPGHSWTVRYRAPGAYVIQGAAPMYRQEGGVPLCYRSAAQRLDRLAADDLR